MKAGVTRTFFFVAVPTALGLVALIFIGMELRNFLFTSSRFAVKQVELVTKGALDREAIIKLAAIPPGANIFTLDLEEIRKRVEADPWIHSATALRVLPNKIQIQYNPEVPMAILGAGSMYYLNREGVPFAKIKSGDSLAFPLVQLEGAAKDSALLRKRVEIALQALDSFRASKLFSEKDLGEITVRTEEEGAPFLLTLRFPPKPLVGKTGQLDRLYTVSMGEEDVRRQLQRWEVVVRHLVQQSKNPRIIRLELGKKVVVKLER